MTATIRSERRVPIAALRELMLRLLIAAGCTEKGAGVAADVFLDADLKGIGLQGLDHMPTLIRHLRTGRTDATAEPTVLHDRLATALVDGHSGLGQVCGVFAADVAIDKARHAGCATVGVVNGGDIFMVGHYAERIARAGLVGLVFSDAPPLVHPHGGTQRMLGTNPLAIGIPSDGPDPMLHDLSTSALSASRIRQAAYHEENVPPGTGVDVHGRATVSAADIRDGAIAPLAGHKGFGLALAIALLSGPLVGAWCGPALNGWFSSEPGPPAARGQLFMAIDPAAFGESSVFLRKVSDHLREIKESRRSPDGSSIRVPGERSFAMRRRQLEAGSVAIYDAVWQRSVALARELDVEIPAGLS